MASDMDIDETMFALDLGIPGHGTAHSYVPTPRITHTAQPFTPEELEAFQIAGEHVGFD